MGSEVKISWQLLGDDVRWIHFGLKRTSFQVQFGCQYLNACDVITILTNCCINRKFPFSSRDLSFSKKKKKELEI